MLCAWIHPFAATALTWIDNMPPIKSNTARTAVPAVCVVVGYLWYIHIYTLPKLKYNEVRSDDAPSRSSCSS